MHFKEIFKKSTAMALAAATVLLIVKYKKSPFFVLLIMGCIGAILGV
jgi:hypothetical protein